MIKTAHAAVSVTIKIIVRCYFSLAYCQNSNKITGNVCKYLTDQVNSYISGVDLFFFFLLL